MDFETLSLFLCLSQIFYVLLTHITNAFQTYFHSEDTLIPVKTLKLKLLQISYGSNFQLNFKQNHPSSHIFLYHLMHSLPTSLIRTLLWVMDNNSCVDKRLSLHHLVKTRCNGRDSYKIITRRSNYNHMSICI